MQTRSPSVPSFMGLQTQANEAPANTTTSMTNPNPPDEPPPRASFMGLPAELRLRIYGFVFVGVDRTRTIYYDLPEYVDKDESQEEEAASANDEHTSEARETEEDNVSEDAQPEEIESQDSDASDCEDEEDRYCLYEDHWEVHCCTISQDDNSYGHTGNIDDDLVCKCHPKPPSLQILRTNKLLFNEAMPVLYNNLELRFALPSIDRKPEVREQKVEDRFLYCLNEVPKYARTFVHRLLLVNSTATIGIHVEQEDDSLKVKSLSPFWDAIAFMLPNVREIRLHLDCYYYHDTSLFAYHEFNGLVNLQQLQRMVLEVSPCHWPRENQAKEDADADWRATKELRKKLLHTIKEEGQRHGRSIDVVVGKVNFREVWYYGVSEQAMLHLSPGRGEGTVPADRSYPRAGIIAKR